MKEVRVIERPARSDDLQAVLSPFALRQGIRPEGRLAGWVHAFIGLASSPVHSGQGIWQHDESWFWLEEQTALGAMALERRNGRRLGIASVWLPLRRRRGEATFGPFAVTGFKGLTWIANMEFLPTFEVHSKHFGNHLLTFPSPSSRRFGAESKQAWRVHAPLDWPQSQVDLAAPR